MRRLILTPTPDLSKLGTLHSVTVVHFFLKKKFSFILLSVIMASQTLPNRRRRRNIDFSKNRDGFLNNFFHSKFFNFCAVRVVVTACVGPPICQGTACCATPCRCPSKTRLKAIFYLFYDFGQFLKPVTDRLENPKNCQNCQNRTY